MADPRRKLFAWGGAVALASACGLAAAAPARAQVEALPPDAAAVMLDAVRAGSADLPGFGMAGLAGANQELLDYVQRARARTAGSLVALGAITAIAQYPSSVAVIVRAALQLAPDSREQIVAHLMQAYPGFSAQIEAAAGMAVAAAPAQPVAPAQTPAPAQPAPSPAASPAVELAQAAPEPLPAARGEGPPVPPSSLGPDWHLRLGVGPGVAPEFQGAGDVDVVPYALVDAVWAGRVFINWRNGLFEEIEDGIGVNAWNLPNLRVALSFRYDKGREESDSSRLRGLGDIDGSVELAALFRLIIEQHWAFSTRLRRDVSGGHEGTLADFLLGYENWLPEGVLYDVNFGATWANKDYMKLFFGVSAAQSARSGFDRYEPEGDFRDIFFNGGVTVYLSERWFVDGRSRFALLTGDAADSPIVKDEFQVEAGVAVGYDF